MKKDIYQVKDHAGRSLGYYSAETAGQAKRAVVAEMQVNKLSGAEIYSVHQNGYGVTNVTDGRFDLTPQPTQADETQASLPIGDETQAS